MGITSIAGSAFVGLTSLTQLCVWVDEYMGKKKKKKALYFTVNCS